MGIADQPILIDHSDQRHSAPFEDVYLLLVALGHRVVRIGQADKWNLFARPIFAERTGRIRADRQNFRAAAGELIVILT